MAYFIIARFLTWPQKFSLNLGAIRTHEETDMKRTRFTEEQAIGILRKSGVSAKCGS
jgi:hypothetical protein